MPKIPSHLIHHDHQFAFQFISFISNYLSLWLHKSPFRGSTMRLVMMLMKTLNS